MRKNTKKVLFWLHVWYFSLRAVLATQRWESERTVIKSMYMPVFIPCMILQIK